jgi:hypothetical protein
MLQKPVAPPLSDFPNSVPLFRGVPPLIYKLAIDCILEIMRKIMNEGERNKTDSKYDECYRDEGNTADTEE